MKVCDLKASLAAASDRELEFRFSDGSKLEAHFHITEVGKVTKDFVDCGGTRRSSTVCMLQSLVAHDVDHRLKADKLMKILEQTHVLGLEENWPVEIEVQQDSISIYSVEQSARHEDAGVLVFELVSKNTACLAPDRCGLETSLPVAGASASGSECGGPGCC